MNGTGGYNSDLNLQDINFVGDFPIENSIGGYGETTGTTDNFLLELTPPISGYRVGMRLHVKFNHANTNIATINVDNHGQVSLRKPVSGILTSLAPDDLNDTEIYTLIFDGIYFQVDISAESSLPPVFPLASENQAGIAPIATQNVANAGSNDEQIISPLKLKTILDNYLNREEVLTIAPTQISSLLSANPGRDKYVAINGNMIITRDIQLRATTATLTFNGNHILNLPKPLNLPPHLNFTQSVSGTSFIVTIDSNGRVFLTGTLSAFNDTLYINLVPYVAKFPLEYFASPPA